MTNEADRAVLSRIIKVDEIKHGARGEIVVAEAEMRVIASMLELVALDGLTLGYRLDKTGSHGALDWPEAVADGKIDLGPVIYEALATALDPYPKKAGASFEWSQDARESPEPKESGPFAALAALKRR
jgi:hypothetical protein